MNDEQELNERLSAPSDPFGEKRAYPSSPPEAPSPMPKDAPRIRMVQWTTDGSRYFPAGRTVSKIDPGLYEIQHDPNIGLFFRALPIKTEGLLRLPDTASDLVVGEIAHFWSRRAAFDTYGLSYKRGILLWGPPGSGKSCTLQLVMRDVMQRGGIGIVFGHPQLTAEGLRMLREIQPDTPIVVLMEDLDSIIQEYTESTVLNLLDGAERIDGVVFVASTNYPELLGARIINRPSRFDRRLKIGHPSPDARRIYLNHIIRGDGAGIDVDKWVEDTEGLSLAHMKELLISVSILGCGYDETIQRLRAMKEVVSSTDDKGKMRLQGSVVKATGYTGYIGYDLLPLRRPLLPTRRIQTHPPRQNLTTGSTLHVLLE